MFYIYTYVCNYVTMHLQAWHESTGEYIPESQRCIRGLGTKIPSIRFHRTVPRKGIVCGRMMLSKP
jgi:hypothetical protein